jgi:hypothetical protein
MSDEKWNGNGWTNYQKLVLAQLEQHQESLEKINDKLNQIRIEITELKVKAGVWGLIAGMIPVIIAMLLHKVKAL